MDLLLGHNFVFSLHCTLKLEKPLKTKAQDNKVTHLLWPIRTAIEEATMKTACTQLLIHTLEQYLDVVGMCEVIRFNGRMVGRVPGSEANNSAGLWVE